jgi:hypothetical protein
MLGKLINHNPLKQQESNQEIKQEIKQEKTLLNYITFGKKK